MQQGGFLDSKPRHPVGMGAVIAAHAVVLTAIILAPPEFVRDGIKHIKLIDIKETPDPKEVKELPKQRETTKKEEHVTRPDTLVQTQPRDTTPTEVVPFDPGAEIKIVEQPHLPPLPPVPDPVMVQARPNMDADAMQPPYPSALARAEIEGKAEIRVLIGTDGRVKQVEEVAATDPGFFEATRQQALRHWRFKPATRDGVPIESWRTMTVRFQLQA